jgi:broad specificity phosphatase PhoE
VSVVPRRTVLLVRHGRTTLNADGRLRGHLDPPLDHVGRREVTDLAAALNGAGVRPVRIVSGPLLRTRQTAGAIAAPHGLPVEVDDRLVDREYGPWTGQQAREVRARFGNDLARLPDAEPLVEVAARARAVLDEQVEYLPRGLVVLVAHDVVNRQLLHDVDPSLGPADQLPQRTGCWNAIELRGDGWHVLQVDQDAVTLKKA